MKSATVAVCLLVLLAGCVVQTNKVTPETATPSTPERIHEKAKTPMQPTTPSALEQDVDVNRIEDLVHREMNEHREAHGVNPLDRSIKLDMIARYKSWDMAQRDYFAHTGPAGTTSSDLRSKFDSTCPNSGQNLFKRTIKTDAKDVEEHFPSESKIATQAVNSLMNSSEHRKNILQNAFEVQGIGVFVDENGTVYLTQEFCG